MKVKLTGIKPHDPEIDGEMDEEYQYYIDQLKQVPFPVIRIADDKYPHTVSLKQYIKDKIYPESEQTWGLVWFTYEEIK